MKTVHMFAGASGFAVKWGGRHLLLAPEGEGGGAAGGTPPTPPAPAPAPPPAAPKVDPAFLAGVKQRRAEREAKRNAPPGQPAPPAIPKEIADKAAAFDTYQKNEKARLDALAVKLTPDAKAVYDAIGDLAGKARFIEFHASKAAQPAGQQPPGAGSPPPSSNTVDIAALIDGGMTPTEARKKHPTEYDAFIRSRASSSSKSATGTASWFRGRK